MTDRGLLIEYLIPIVSSEKSRLFTEVKYENLSRLTSIKDFIDELTKTKYEKYLKKYKYDTNQDIEWIFHEYLISKYIKFLKAAPQQINDYLYHEFLKYEIENIKKLIKAKIIGIDYSQISKLIHLSPEIYLKRQNLFEELMHSAGLLELIDSIEIEFYSNALKEALHVYKEENSVYLFDILLDIEYFKNLLNQSEKLNSDYKKFIQTHLKFEIDIYNILTILRSQILQLGAHQIYRFIVRDERVSNDNFYEDLIKSEDFDKSLKILKEYFQIETNEFDQISNLIQLNSYFKNKKLEFYRFWAEKRNFSIDYPYSILKLIEIEVKNLIAILYGIEYNVAPDALHKNIIII